MAPAVAGTRFGLGGCVVREPKRKEPAAGCFAGVGLDCATGPKLRGREGPAETQMQSAGWLEYLCVAMSMGFILPLSARVLHSVSSYVGSFVDIGGGAEAGRRAAADLSLHDKAILRPFRLDVFPHVLLRLWFVPALEIGRSSLL